MMDFRKNILIVDRNQNILDALRLALANVEIQVITADSLAEAERAIRQLSFDLIVTEMNLSPGDRREGFDLLASAHKHNPSAKVIFMTCCGTPEMEHAALNRGAYLYLNKPFDLKSLEIHLEKLGFR